MCIQHHCHVWNITATPAPSPLIWHREQRSLGEKNNLLAAASLRKRYLCLQPLWSLSVHCTQKHSSLLCSVLAFFALINWGGQEEDINLLHCSAYCIAFHIWNCLSPLFVMYLKVHVFLLFGSILCPFRYIQNSFWPFYAMFICFTQFYDSSQRAHRT